MTFNSRAVPPCTNCPTHVVLLRQKTKAWTAARSLFLISGKARPVGTKIGKMTSSNKCKKTIESGRRVFMSLTPKCRLFEKNNSVVKRLPQVSGANENMWTGFRRFNELIPTVSHNNKHCMSDVSRATAHEVEAEAFGLAESFCPRVVWRGESEAVADQKNVKGLHIKTALNGRACE